MLHKSRGDDLSAGAAQSPEGRVKKGQANRRCYELMSVEPEIKQQRSDARLRKNL